MACTGISCSKRRDLANLGDRRADCCGSRPARQGLGDHRRIYLEYEGEISGGRGRVRRLDSGTYRAILWSADRVQIEIAGSQLAGAVELRFVGGEPRRSPLDLPYGKLGLKHLARRKRRPAEGPPGPVRAAGQPDLTIANLNLFELDVLSFKIRRIANDDHWVTIPARPLDIDTMIACIVDNAIEEVIRRNGHDSRPDLFQSQFDGISLGNCAAGQPR